MVRDSLVCGACGAGVDMTLVKCPYCGVGFAPMSTPLPITQAAIEVRPQEPSDDSEDHEPKISTMCDGEVGYVVPWALSTGGSGINKNYTFSRSPGGTATLKIKMDRGTILVGKWSFRKEETSGWLQSALLPVRLVFRI